MMMETDAKSKQKTQCTDHSKSASAHLQELDVMDTECVFPITHLDVDFSFR